jgi:hypothetical protein
MSEDVVDFTTKRIEAMRQETLRRVAQAIPVLLGLPAESVKELVEALSLELSATLVDLMSPGSIDLFEAKHGLELQEALSKSLPQTYGTHDYYALYATGITLTRLISVLVKMGKEQSE